MQVLDITPVLRVSAEYTERKPWRNITSVMLQLSSETGEMCDWINRPHRQKEIFAGECADVINCVIDALWLHMRDKMDGASHEEVALAVTEELNRQLHLKTKKWSEAVNAIV